MSKAGDSILTGLREALEFTEKRNEATVIHRVRVPVVDVREVRAKTGLSQKEFSLSIGVAKGTLLNWEQGRRKPTGPARVLLAILNKKPSLVTSLLCG